jgi:transcriptional regulator with XRE-family HTH domain
MLLSMKRSSDTNMTVFGRNLWALRRRRGMRQDDLAKALGVTRFTVSYYESKAKNPTTEFVQKAADFFGVGTDDLLREAADRRPKPGPKSKIERQLEAIRRLPPKKQKTVSEMLDMVLAG